MVSGCPGTGTDEDTDVGPPEGFAAVEVIFAESCVSSGCHGGPEPTTGLDLSPGVAYGKLVSVPSEQTALDRVVPGDPELSYVMHKLRGTYVEVGGSDETDRMPPGFGISGDRIAVIERWIAEGAEE